MLRRLAIGVVSAALLATLGTGLVAAKAGALNAELVAVRAAVAKYHDYDQALLDGYSLAGESCVFSADGTIGYHAVNFDLAVSGRNDPARPPILLYTPRNDSLELVAVEYFQVALANTESGPALWWDASQAPALGFFNPAPSIFGRSFDGPMAGHNSQMPWHYDLHAWVVESNPAGVFEMFNPAISCNA